ncbi:MAG: PQQ-binding-like beta-propeller repeat protein [Planctomycetota bacterium]|nr:PQQ-binding-like beta-propeller repeat protein [Planctomycetota bacterium]
MSTGRVRSITCALALLGAPAAAGDWPMYRADAERSAHTAEALPADLARAWTFVPDHAPAPAWPNLARMRFDRAHHVAVAEGIVVFGGSVDGRVVALDAADGRPRWTAFCEGPVRFAPAIAEGLALVASDDGFLRAFDLRSGEIRWQRRGGPDGRRVLGNGRVISRWPARGGPVVRDGVVYFTAGIWPSDGVFVLALEVATGRTLWVEDESGALRMAQPHGGAEAESGVAAQGHLVATGERLLVPTGRAVPAAFARADGAFEYYHLQSQSPRGGTATMASGKLFFNSGRFFDAKTGAAAGSAGSAGSAVAGLPEGLVTTSPKGLTLYRWRALEDGTRALRPALEVPAVTADRSLIVCGEEAFAGGAGGVARVECDGGEVVWRASDMGAAVEGLAAADGRLFASLADGRLVAFASGAAEGGERSVPRGAPPIPDPAVEDAAREILARTGASAGYCVDLEAGDGALAAALARHSDLFVIALVADADQARTTRAQLAAQGLLGSRVGVHTAGASDAVDFPAWIADLVVSAASLSGARVDREAARRLQRPEGGVTCFGPIDDLDLDRRAALPGAGSWTHQYADAANTVCSNDTVGGPLGMRWFAEVDQRITQRHGRGPAPLVHGGRIFSLGQDSLVAVDAYNGRVLWEIALPGILAGYEGDHLMGTAGVGGLACVTADALFLRREGHCLRLDTATGEETARWVAPPPRGGGEPIWGAIATDGERLFGSLADPDHVVTYRYVNSGDLAVQLTESTALFALDAADGTQLWRYDADHSLRHNAIALGAGRVFLVDRPQAEADRTREPVEGAVHAPGVLRALDAADGSLVWEQDEVWGTLLAFGATADAVLMAYQPTRFRLGSEVGGRLAAFAAADGSELWSEEASYASRPVIVGGTIYAQGGAWDLATGAAADFPFSRSYGCGVLACGENLAVFRSATLGYTELTEPARVHNFGGLRPGCWINAIPAAGLVLVPDGSAGCVCSYQNRSWVALHGEDVAPPRIEPPGGVFEAPVEVVLEVRGARPGAVRYTLDGSRPSAASPLAAGPVTIDADARLRAAVFVPGAHPSAPVGADFRFESPADSDG